MNRFDKRGRSGRKLGFKTCVQLDAFAFGGRAACGPKAARTVLEMVTRIAALHDQQGRHDATISITPQQEKRLASLKLPTGELRFYEHPLRVVEDL